MREILIIFIILLVLLMLISAFGGSIRQKEMFFVNAEDAMYGPLITEEESKYPSLVPTSYTSPSTYAGIDGSSSFASSSSMPMQPEAFTSFPDLDPVALQKQQANEFAKKYAESPSPVMSEMPPLATTSSVIEKLNVDNVVESATKKMSSAISESQLMSSLLNRNPVTEKFENCSVGAFDSGLDYAYIN